jgi:hypothetical protein
MYEIEVEEDAEEVELIGEESGGPVDLNDIMADDSDEKTTGTE